MRKNSLSIKIILTITFVFLFIQDGLTQFSWAEIGVNGLTCSQCSRSVEMSILKLTFVKEVKMDLESTVGKIIFIQGSEISFKKIAKAITDAGFSIRYLKAAYPFNDFDKKDNFIPLNASGQFCFVNSLNKKLNGEVLLTFLGKEFMPKQEYNKWKELIKKACGEFTKESYYITIQS